MECNPAETRPKESQKRMTVKWADCILINVMSRLQRISYRSKADDVLETKAVEFNQPNKVWKKGVQSACKLPIYYIFPVIRA